MTPSAPISSTPAQWYRIRLSRDEYEGGEASVIQSAFQRIFVASNAPKGMAMLGAWENGDEAYSVYFTPDSLPHARALVEAYSAEPHQPPSRRLALLFGDAPH
jgi:hypothetical protein